MSFKKLEFHVILSPFLRAFLFVMDIIKDYLLVQLLAQYIFDFGKDRTTDEDYYLFAVSIFSLMIGHISILCVTVPNRYKFSLDILCKKIGKGLCYVEVIDMNCNLSYYLLRLKA